MSTQRTFSTEDLTAYLDGEADAGLARAIEEAKTQTPDINARLLALGVDRDRIRSAFDGVLPLAPVLPASIGKTPDDVPRAMPWRAIAATALVSLGIGWGASNLLTRAQTETWQHFAATYHAMYVHDTLAHVRPTAQTASDELQRVSAGLGLTVPLTTVATTDQLEFRRAQMLGFAGRPVAQLAFVSKTGAPIALCIALTDGTQSESVRPATMLGMRAATWSKGRYQYLLIGGSDAAVIATAAAAFAKAL